MFNILLYLVLGAVGGHLLALFAHRSPDRTSRIFSHTLLIAAFIYVAFAMASMESVWLAVEIAGLLIFLGFAYVGLHRSLVWLWLGWALHILWDAGIHMMLETPFVPDWYPALCIGFDAVVAYHVYKMQQRVSRDVRASA